MADLDIQRRELGGQLNVRYKDIGGGVYVPYVELFTAGGGGGGLAQTQVRSAANAWTDVGYFGGNLSMPVSFAGGVDVTDRAARLVGVVYGSQAAQLKQTATNFNLATEIHVGATAVDPRSIRALTSADVVTIAGTVPVSGTFWQATQPVSVAAVLPVSKSGVWPLDTAAKGTTVAGSPTSEATDANTQSLHARITNASIPVTGTFWQATQPVSLAAAVDVSDRAVRLVGVVYGSQGQQLKQTATNFNAQVEIAVGATLVDPRSIRALTSADIVTAAQGAAAATAGAWPAKITDGTNIAAVKAASIVALATDPALVVQQSPQNAQAATLIVTATGAAAAAVTATLPAPAAGLFHYITRINIIKYASVATVGAAAPTVITTTNLPGAVAWTLPTALAVGTQYETDVEPASPIKSSVAATATTIVAAGLASIIYRITVYYYSAP